VSEEGAIVQKVLRNARDVNFEYEQIESGVPSHNRANISQWERWKFLVGNE
jgi:hypothetical protein